MGNSNCRWAQDNKGVRARFARFIFGLMHSFELNIVWIYVYGGFSALIFLVHQWFHQQAVKGSDLLVVSIALLTLVISFMLRKNLLRVERRSFVKLVVFAFPIAGFLVITAATIVKAPNNEKSLLISSFVVGFIAWLVSTIVIALIGFIPGTVLNKDFAKLSHFPFTGVIRFLSGAFLFIVAGQQLVFWPAIQSAPATEMVAVFKHQFYDTIYYITCGRATLLETMACLASCVFCTGHMAIASWAKPQRPSCVRFYSYRNVDAPRSEVYRLSGSWGSFADSRCCACCVVIHGRGTP